MSTQNTKHFCTFLKKRNGNRTRNKVYTKVTITRKCNPLCASTTYNVYLDNKNCIKITDTMGYPCIRAHYGSRKEYLVQKLIEKQIYQNHGKQIMIPKKLIHEIRKRHDCSYRHNMLYKKMWNDLLRVKNVNIKIHRPKKFIHKSVQIPTKNGVLEMNPYQTALFSKILPKNGKINSEYSEERSHNPFREAQNNRPYTNYHTDTVRTAKIIRNKIAIIITDREVYSVERGYRSDTEISNRISVQCNDIKYSFTSKDRVEDVYDAEVNNGKLILELKMKDKDTHQYLISDIDIAK